MVRVAGSGGADSWVPAGAGNTARPGAKAGWPDAARATDPARPPDPAPAGLTCPGRPTPGALTCPGRPTPGALTCPGRPAPDALTGNIPAGPAAAGTP
jgi:hypothetical protein